MVNTPGREASVEHAPPSLRPSHFLAPVQLGLLQSSERVTMGIRARFHHCDSGRGRHSHPTSSGCLFTASLPLSLLFPSPSTSLLSHHHSFLALGSANIGVGTEHEEAASERSEYPRGTGGMAFGVDGRGRLAVWCMRERAMLGKGRGGEGKE